MTEKHWGDEEFLARLYGLGADDGHLEICGRCSARWSELQNLRDRMLAREPRVSKEFLAAQRRSIYSRLGRKSRWTRLQLSPSLAALLLIMVVLTILRPAPDKMPQETISDLQVFEEVFQTAASSEPSAVEPVRSLFEVQQ
jgi:hypothetical protein